GQRRERLLADELQQVGDGLQQAVGARPIGPVAELHAPHDLALEQGRVGEGEEDDVDDHDRLDDRDPPGLDRAGDERHALTTSTAWRRSPACSSAMRATPGRSFLLMVARSASDVPFERTETVSPLAIWRRSASSGESSSTTSGRWNWSSGTRSTAGPENRAR